MTTLIAEDSSANAFQPMEKNDDDSSNDRHRIETENEDKDGCVDDDEVVVSSHEVIIGQNEDDDDDDEEGNENLDELQDEESSSAKQDFIFNNQTNGSSNASFDQEYSDDEQSANKQLRPSDERPASYGSESLDNDNVDEEEDYEDEDEEHQQKQSILQYEDDDEDEEVEIPEINSTQPKQPTPKLQIHFSSICTDKNENDEKEREPQIKSEEKLEIGKQSPNNQQFLIKADSKDLLTEDQIMSNLDENGIYKWLDFHNVKVKNFSPKEIEKYQAPFFHGWKRELVLRCALSSGASDKKPGDVYYHTPDGTSKLRSCVEMRNYLKRHVTDDLTEENFTFAKQPVWRPPDEIVRHALQRGANFVQRPFSFNQHIKPKHYPRQKNSFESTQSNKHRLPADQSLDSLHSKNESFQQQNEDSMDQETSMMMGRGKRKRVLPSRYEDNEVDLIPLKKKNNRESYSNSNSNDSPPAINNQTQNQHKTNGSTSHQNRLKQQERHRALQQALYQQIHEEQMKSEKEAAAAATSLAALATSTPAKTKQDQVSIIKSSDQRDSSSLKMKFLLNQKRTKNVDEDLIEQKPEEKSNSTKNANHREPCNTNCPGRLNIIPNLMCCRCFCLYHLECVPDGMFIPEMKVFICPNCLRPEDKESRENSQNRTTTTSNGSMTITVNGGQSSTKELPSSNSLLLKRVDKASQNQASSKYRSINEINSSLLIEKKSFNNKKRQPNGYGNNSNKSMLSAALTQPQNPNNFHSVKIPMNGLYQSSLKQRIVPPLPSSNRTVPHGPSLHHQQSIDSFDRASNQPANSVQQFQPSINHVYRLAQGSNGRSVVIKEKTTPLSTSSHQQQKFSSNNLLLQKQNLLKNASNLYQENFALLNAAAKHIAAVAGSKSTKKDDSPLLIKPSALFLSTINTDCKYFRYLYLKHNTVNFFDSNLIVLVKILDYLDLRDLLNLRAASRHWYQLTSMPIVWRQVRLNGITLKNFEKFRGNVIQRYEVKSVDFSGVRIPIEQDQSKFLSNSNEQICRFWRSIFSTIIRESLDYFESLSFGTIPMFFINQLISLNPKSLRCLSCSNMFDESHPSEPCSVEFLSQINLLENLESIRIESQNEFVLINEQDRFEKICDALRSISSTLHSFSCTSFRDLTAQHFLQLISSFDSQIVKAISLGSCKNLFASTVKDTETTFFNVLAQFNKLLNLHLKDVVINEHSTPLSSLFESLIIVEKLSLENLIIHKSGESFWETFQAILKSLPLKELDLSSNDSFTNQLIFISVIKLMSVQKRRIHIRWSISVNLDDEGIAYVPIWLAPDLVTQNEFIQKYFDSSKGSKNDESNQKYQVCSANDSKTGESSSSDGMILVESDFLRETIMKHTGKQDRSCKSTLVIIPK